MVDSSQYCTNGFDLIFRHSYSLHGAVDLRPVLHGSLLVLSLKHWNQCIYCAFWPQLAILIPKLHKSGFLNSISKESHDPQLENPEENVDTYHSVKHHTSDAQSQGQGHSLKVVITDVIYTQNTNFKNGHCIDLNCR